MCQNLSITVVCDALEAVLHDMTKLPIMYGVPSVMSYMLHCKGRYFKDVCSATVKDALRLVAYATHLVQSL